jgi:lysyl-tRNA synthetase class 2
MRDILKSDPSGKNKVLLQERRNKLEQLRGVGLDPYAQDFHPKNDIGAVVESHGPLEAGALEDLEQRLSVAGRMTAKRDFGKVFFADLMDRSGKIQIFVQKTKCSTEQGEILRCLDVGDYCGVRGRLFRTRTGELTIDVSELCILAKALRPLPEKWHGIRDTEARYRQRYLDLLMNPRVKEVFRLRSLIIQGIREFLNDRGFWEVETPMMQPIPGGADARPFVTHHNALGRDLYLRVAPELYLKRLVIGGLERVYEINRNFRNEGVSTQHNPEFTMLEFYQAYADFGDLMAFTEELVTYLLDKVSLDRTLTYQGKEIHMAPPWKRIRFMTALEEIGGISQDIMDDPRSLGELAEERGIGLQDRRTRGKVLAKLFDAVVEPHLQDPTFVTHYPVEISPLSRRNLDEPHLVDRFELIVAGREIANAFTELTDPDDQRMRFMEQKTLRDQGDEEAHPLDEDFLRALEYGMPPTAGEGIGIDRLVMLLTNSSSIRDVILFPHLRPGKGVDI